MRPGRVPARSDTALVTSQTYNAAGWVLDVTDPRGIGTRTEYDSKGRRTKSIEAYTDGTPTTTSNKTVQYGYDGSGHLTSLTVVLPGGGQQQTQWVYGVTGTIASNELLKEMRYPDAPSRIAVSLAMRKTQPTCRRCSREVPAASLVRLWDGRAYCADCVNEVCPELLAYANEHAALEETLPEGSFARPRYGLVVLLLWAAFVTLLVLTCINPVDLLPWSCGLGVLLLLSAHVLGILWLCRYAAWRKLPRTIRVKEGKVTERWPGASRAFRLARCRWMRRDTSWDLTTFYLPRRPAIVIVPPEGYAIVCGLSPETYALWEGLLRLNGIREQGRFPLLALLAYGLLGTILGALLGASLGIPLAPLMNDPWWPVALGFLLGADGLYFGMCYVLVSKWLARPNPNNFRLLLFLGFAKFGLFTLGRGGFGGVAGIPVTLAICLLNGALGLVVCRAITKRYPFSGPTRNGPRIDDAIRSRSSSSNRGGPATGQPDRPPT